MTFMSFGRFFLICTMIGGLALTGCASTSSTTGEAGEDSAVYDPWEGYNRNAFEFNNALDQALAKPVVLVYRALLPQGVRNGIHNLLITLKSPLTLANQLLQGDLEGAGTVVARTTINTFTGLGVLDNAGAGGLKHEPEDFGQTLAVWGVHSGPYLVLPFFDPSTVIDTAGIVVDSYADPLRIYLFNTDREALYYGRVATTLIDKRDRVNDALEDLRANSFDFYAAVRSAYFQHRNALINDQDPEDLAAPEIPDYDEEW
jgi:phospholipid-binding lipoprotein MlaA